LIQQDSENLANFKLNSGDEIRKKNSYSFYQVLTKGIYKPISMNNRSFRLSGQVSDFPLPEVIQFLGMTRKTGELRIFNGQPDKWASLFFCEETLLHAQCDYSEGVEAFLRIINRDNGHFHFFSDYAPLKQTINKPVHYLMLQVQNQLDEMRNVDKQLPSADTTIIFSTLVDPIPRLTTQDWLVLSQINGRRTLGQIIQKCGNELSSKKILLKLLSHHLIAPASEARSLERLIPLPLDSEQTGSERPYPPRLRTNLLLKEIDGKKTLQQLGEHLNMKERDLLEDIRLLLDSQWIGFPSQDQLTHFLSLCEEY